MGIKTTPPTQNSWTAFVESVKLLTNVKEFTKKEVEVLMKWYISGKSAENYVIDNNVKENM